MIVVILAIGLLIFLSIAAVIAWLFRRALRNPRPRPPYFYAAVFGCSVGGFAGLQFLGEQGPLDASFFGAALLMSCVAFGLGWWFGLHLRNRRREDGALKPQSPIQRHIWNAVKSILIGIPAGSFVCGLLICKDCGADILARLLAGLIGSLMGTVFLGFPPQNAGGAGGTLNYWPAILPAVALCFLLFTLHKNPN